MSEINKNWFDYYETLERIRQSGITNMYGAAPYLAACCDIDEKLATKVLISWMKNYTELAKLLNWKR